MFPRNIRGLVHSGTHLKLGAFPSRVQPGGETEESELNLTRVRVLSVR